MISIKQIAARFYWDSFIRDAIVKRGRRALNITYRSFCSHLDVNFAVYVLTGKGSI